MAFRATTGTRPSPTSASASSATTEFTRQQPACTEVCPTKATIFGDRDALLAEAHRRIAEIRDNTSTKSGAKHEVGGTSVLYISNVDLHFFAGDTRWHRIRSPRTTAVAMAAVPFTFTGVLAAMAGVNWMIAAAHQAPDGEDPMSRVRG